MASKLLLASAACLPAPEGLAIATLSTSARYWRDGMCGLRYGRSALINLVIGPSKLTHVPDADYAPQHSQSHDSCQFFIKSASASIVPYFSIGRSQKLG